MKIAGFLKVRNEILKGGNLYRALDTLAAHCDGGVICDDASFDGTREYLQAWVEARNGWALLKVPPAAQDFAAEMAVKQEMINILHAQQAAGAAYDWIFWLDGDESIEATRADVESILSATDRDGVTCHYTQLWRGTSWARTDDGFDDGYFVKFWRYSPALSFNTASGTHHQQFPQEIVYERCATAPFDVIHWGNVGVNLRWKAIQYSGGRGGVDRHIGFGHTEAESLASGNGFDLASWSRPEPTYRRAVPSDNFCSTFDHLDWPRPLTLDQIRRIRALNDLTRLPETFAVIVPTFNRANDLPKALDSLIAQSYEKWIAFVLDDGSTDNTAEVMAEYQEKDPRIFYARYLTNRGGVAMNEIGMTIACETAQWWTRLGSDDWFGPNKLKYDALALAEHSAVYGAYTVVRDVAGREAFGEICNPPMVPDEIKAALLNKRYLVSWANVAVRCSVLAQVRAIYGSFCDPRIRNMEDFLCNARIASIAPFVWRGPEARLPVAIGQAWNYGAVPELEAVWRAAPEGGASSPENAAIMNRDHQLTYEGIEAIRG